MMTKMDEKNVVKYCIACDGILSTSYTNTATRDATASTSNATQPTPQQTKAYLRRRTSMPSVSTSRQ